MTTAISPTTSPLPTTATQPRSILASLRRLIPQRSVQMHEALRIAELQANRLLTLLGDDSIDAHHLSTLPRIRITYERLPVSGLSYWNGREWIIAIHQFDPLVRQRFTLLHEFKHIIDHGSVDRLYTDTRFRSAEEQAENAADYFAGCALIPRRSLKAAWGNGLQTVAVLADHFSVSQDAIRVRLAQTGLDTAVDQLPAPRCARPTRIPRHERQRFRAAHTSDRGR